MKQERPRFISMWVLFTTICADGTVFSVGKTIGGMVEKNIELGKVDPDAGFGNACAIRISYCLNYSDIIISPGQWKSVSGADKKQYIFRVNDLYAFLTSVFGKPDKTASNPTPKDFSGLRGILIFKADGWINATGHATMWDGTTCGDKCYYPRSVEASIWLLK